jgi:nitrogen fixation/metabolism regulation signal transduction histidine kinase
MEWRLLIPEEQSNNAMELQRKKTWIHPFQTGLLVRIVVYLLAYQLIATAFSLYCERMDAAFVAQGVHGHFLGNAFVRSLLALLLLVPMLAADAIYFAHRLVGPLYRFRKTMQTIAAGQPVAPVKLRKGDLLVDFQNDFNAMLAYLEQQGFVLTKRTDSPVGTEQHPITRSLKRLEVPKITPAS